MRDKLAFAADLELHKGVEIYRSISAHVGYAKVGLSLFVEHGPRAVEPFLKAGAKVFLDLKLHDIPNTVELAAARAAGLGVSLLTVHAQGGEAMLQAALRGAGGKLRILAVTVLTSLDARALADVGHEKTPAELALQLAHTAQRAGIDGFVCSAQEVFELRAAVGPKAFLCTPGIRPAGSAVGDQARVETPKAAISAGSDLLVIGRPLYQAGNPAEAARQIAAEIQ